MAILHLMIGLPCSGKTTEAKRLEKEFHALRLTPDEWQLRLFGDDVGLPEHDWRHTEIEHIMWDITKRALELGTSVVLDFGCWAREERDDFRARAKALGAGFRLHYMALPMDEIFQRLEKRNADNAGDVFVIPREEMLSYMKVFQPPEPDEMVDDPEP